MPKVFLPGHQRHFKTNVTRGQSKQFDKDHFFHQTVLVEASYLSSAAKYNYFLTTNFLFYWVCWQPTISKRQVLVKKNTFSSSLFPKVDKNIGKSRVWNLGEQKTQAYALSITPKPQELVQPIKQMPTLRMGRQVLKTLPWQRPIRFIHFGVNWRLSEKIQFG